MARRKVLIHLSSLQQDCVEKLFVLQCGVQMQTFCFENKKILNRWICATNINAGFSWLEGYPLPRAIFNERLYEKSCPCQPSKKLAVSVHVCSECVQTCVPGKRVKITEVFTWRTFLHIKRP